LLSKLDNLGEANFTILLKKARPIMYFENNPENNSDQETSSMYQAQAEHQPESGRSVAGQKSSEGGRGNPEKASPAAIERYLKGIHFPVNKNNLIEHAQQQGAPSDVLSVLNRFDEQEYHSVIDISKEVSRVE
jgi:hypothetical protein